MALVIDYALPYLRTLYSAPLQVAGADAGVFIIGFGSVLYLVTNLGPGPLGGLITSLQKIIYFHLVQVRGGIELHIVCAGCFEAEQLDLVSCWLL